MKKIKVKKQTLEILEWVVIIIVAAILFIAMIKFLYMSTLSSYSNAARDAYYSLAVAICPVGISINILLLNWIETFIEIKPTNKK